MYSSYLSFHLWNAQWSSHGNTDDMLVIVQLLGRPATNRHTDCTLCYPCWIPLGHSHLSFFPNQSDTVRKPSLLSLNITDAGVRAARHERKAKKNNWEEEIWAINERQFSFTTPHRLPSWLYLSRKKAKHNISRDVCAYSVLVWAKKKPTLCESERMTKDVNRREETWKLPHTGRNNMDVITYLGPCENNKGLNYSTNVPVKPVKAHVVTQPRSRVRHIKSYKRRR